ncbi:hypothetical protein [Sphingopyxis sp. C-1]|jgi:hypothetical protein|uniref:hypothetical protein n=1 Tax=Sphingopyxis sp. C-1 TaxID=262667 RepID=UPI0006C1C315|nr:hypothetical protein [Sphingopyxis sp. C-1]GAO78611.1 hypothetical protein SC1_01920 [Sphingopyxis sp. C-1]
MRFVRQIVHLLIGLLATAFVAAAASLVWPTASHWIWIAAYVVMVVLALRELIMRQRTKPGG